jgi:amidase
VDPGSLRCGFVPSAPPDLAPFTDDAKRALAETLALMTSLGHEVEDSHPSVLDTEGIGSHYFKIGGVQLAAAARQLEQVLERELTEGDFDAWTWTLMQQGSSTSSVEYIAYGDWCNTMARGAGEWWARGYDVLVIPTVSGVAPELGYYKLRPGEDFAEWVHRYHAHVPYTQIWNATGQPAISLPLHTTADGLPLGVMIVADYGREDLLLQLASQLEEAAPWRDRHPKISLNLGAVEV